MDADQLAADLERFRDSEHLYEHSTKLFEYTDGVKYLAENAGAYWLLDMIAAWQKRTRKDSRLRGFQLWILEVQPDHRAILNCYADPNDLRFLVRIPFTDFPLPSLKLYLENGVLCLPKER